MKKKLGILVVIFFVISLMGIGITNMQQIEKKEKEKEFVIVTSFTPIYVLASNLVKNTDHVKVENLAQTHGKCLHDYQLTTEDMKKLETADVFVMNGGGMEGFVEEIVKTYPDLIVIDSSEEVTMLANEATHFHHHENEEEIENQEDEHEEESEHEEEEAHNHGTYNSHIWLSTKNYQKQIKQITKGLIKNNSTNAKMYQKNAEVYCEKVIQIEEKIQQAKEKIKGTEVISFHEGFAYLAQQLEIEVVKLLNLDENSGLSAGEMAETINEIREHHIEYVLVEEANADLIRDSIGKETDVKVLVVSTLLSENQSLDSYLKGMEQNLNALLEIVKNQ